MKRKNGNKLKISSFSYPQLLNVKFWQLKFHFGNKRRLKSSKKKLKFFSPSQSFTSKAVCVSKKIKNSSSSRGCLLLEECERRKD